MQFVLQIAFEKKKKKYFFLGYDLSRATSVIKQILGSSLVGLSVLLIFCSFVKKPSGWCETLKCDGGEQKNMIFRAVRWVLPCLVLASRCTVEDSLPD